MPAAPAGADYTALLYPKTRRPVKERRFTPSAKLHKPG